MENNYLYFQPEYVDKFQCKGANCNAACCKGWRIFIDEKTYEQYSQAADAQEIIKHMEFDSAYKNYLVTLDEKNFCPFLNEDNLCRLQLEHGEEFLSKTCATYPRRTLNFKRFFERSLTLSCPVVADLILFNREPMRFEFVKVSEKIHSVGDKILMNSLPIVTEAFADMMFEVQGTMISILQERRLSLNQRLIVLGFFLDKLEEIQNNATGISAVREIKKLLASYNPKIFLRNGVPSVIKSLNFDTQKFIVTMANLFATLCTSVKIKFVVAVIDVLAINPDENNRVSISKVVANYERLADKRKIFLEKYSTVLENYLVNELFLNFYPWRFKESITNNVAFFIATYKIFELIIFVAMLKGLDSRKDLVDLISWFVRKIDHGSKALQKKIFGQIDNDLLNLMESLLDGQ